MSFLNRKNLTRITFISSIILLIPTAKAENNLENKKWKLHIAPYVWAPKLKGVLKSNDGPLASPLSEKWGNSKVSYFLSGSVRKDRYVFLADAGHSSQNEILNLPYGIKGDLRVKQKYFTLTGGYNFILNKKNSIDAMAGFRWWHLQGSIDADQFGIHKHIDKSFASTILALNWNHQFNEKISTAFYVDYGGIISKTNKTYQAVALATYSLNEYFKFGIGYRLLEVDYREDGKRLDIEQSGPLIAAIFKF